jgi:hypothetical protein
VTDAAQLELSVLSGSSILTMAKIGLGTRIRNMSPLARRKKTKKQIQLSSRLTHQSLQTRLEFGSINLMHTQGQSRADLICGLPKIEVILSLVRIKIIS